MSICSFLSHLDNINRKKSKSSSVENDLKIVKKELEKSQAPTTSKQASDDASGKESIKTQPIVKNEELICDKNIFEKLMKIEAESETTAAGEFSTVQVETKELNEEEIKELEAIRKRRLEHFGEEKNKV